MHINISSCLNSKVKEYLKLRDNKKYKNSKNKFTVEGVRSIHDVIKNKVQIDRLFLTENCIKKISNTKYNLNDYSEICIINEKIAKKMSLLKSNQGAFAVVKKPDNFKLEKIRRNDLILALYNIQDPGNLGTILRSALSFGFLKIVVFNCCDVYSAKVIRSSVGTIFRLSFLISKDFYELLDFFQKNNIPTFASTPRKDAMSSKKLENKKGVLILGNEGSGLPQEIIQHCKFKVKIEMKKDADSLNVATAGSILMYEMKSLD